MSKPTQAELALIETWTIEKREDGWWFQWEAYQVDGVTYHECGPYGVKDDVLEARRGLARTMAKIGGCNDNDQRTVECVEVEGAGDPVSGPSGDDVNVFDPPQGENGGGISDLCVPDGGGLSDVD